MRLNKYGRAVAFSIFILLFASECFAHADWKLIAQSNLIVVGKLTPPIDEIEQNQRTQKHSYVSIPVSVARCLKGAPCPSSIMLSYYTEPSTYKPSPQAVVDASGRNVVLFLVRGDEPNNHNLFYFVNPNALHEQSPKYSDSVIQEVDLQYEAPAYLRSHYDSKKDPLFNRVKLLIDATTNSPEEQRKAFSELEQLGLPAVPAMIMLMDDRRRLAEPSISLRNKSENAFEGIRHYGPGVVVDAVAAILNQLTWESFGWVYNGGSEEARRATIDGWSVYLYYLLRNPD